MTTEIKIIDVIITPSKQRFVIVDRNPDFVYEKKGNKLMAHDSGFYDFMTILPGTTDAFAGRKFDIRLTDGSVFQCRGQVWSTVSNSSEPVLQVGYGTLEGLRKCYVFCGARLRKSKLDEWLANNKPSSSYYKHDYQSSLEYLDSLFDRDLVYKKTICAKRSRTLKKRGARIGKDKETGKRYWSPSYEKRKAEYFKMQEEQS